MGGLRYSTTWLWLKYVNREPRVAGMVIGLLIGAIMSPVVFIVWFQLPFLIDGETVQAKVLAKHQARAPAPGAPLTAVSLFAHGGKRGPSYLLRYEYVDAAGKRHEGEGSTSFSHWTNAKPGDFLAVRYVQSDPTRSKLESTVWDFWPAIPFGILALLVTAHALWVGAAAVRWVNWQVRLVRDGEALPGRITRAAAEYRGKRRTDVVSVLEYEYAAPGHVTGTLEVRGKLPPRWRTGGGILILVDPNDPTIHAPDIFDARREDRFELLGDG